MTYYKGENDVLEHCFFCEMGHRILRWKRSWQWASSSPYFTKCCPELSFDEQQSPLSRLEPRSDATWFSCHTTNLRRPMGGVSLNYEGKITQDWCWGFTSLVIPATYYSEVRFRCNRLKLKTFFLAGGNWL